MKGLKGDKGDKGEQGIQGIPGEQGLQGLQGIQGFKGDTGDSAYQIWLSQGNDGPISDYILSLKGDKGEQGEQGIQGERGFKGDTGLQGDKGEQGPKGDKGDQGLPGQDGSDATVTNANVINALGYTPANETGVIDTGSTNDGTAFTIEETNSSQRAAIFLRSAGKRAGFFWYGINHPSGYSGKFRIHLDAKSDVLYTNVNDVLVDGKKVYHEGNLPETDKEQVGLGEVDNVKQMPISGGVLENYREKLTTLASGTINLNTGNVFTHTLSGNTTYSITNAVNGQAHSFTLIITQTATVRTLTFPASVKWQGGEIPDMTTASKTYVLTFMTVDGGTNWLGMFGGEF